MCMELVQASWRIYEEIGDWDMITSNFISKFQLNVNQKTIISYKEKYRLWKGAYRAKVSFLYGIGKATFLTIFAS